METCAVVGGAPGGSAIEVVVVDAETARLRSLGHDPLAPQAVLSIPFEGDIEVATAEARQRIRG